MESHTIKVQEKQIDAMAGRIALLEEKVEGLLAYLLDSEHAKCSPIDRAKLQSLAASRFRLLQGAADSTAERRRLERELEREAAIERLVREQRRADELGAGHSART